jgi:flagellar L-ring protein precursor FlgH
MRKVYLSFCAMLCAMLVMVLLTGCQTAPRNQPKEDDSLSWAQEPAPAASNGAIYQVGRDVPLFENSTARRIGDTVTIVLNEATAAKKSATTTTTKNTNTTLPGMTLFGSPVTVHGTPVLSNNINDANKFDGEGDSAQSNSLTGFVTCTVVRVLPNGNLLVRGQKQIWINQGSEYVRLEGVVRPIDLAPDNSVPSQKVAGARISYTGKGALADANAAGWLSRFFNSPWTPF